MKSITKRNLLEKIHNKNSRQCVTSYEPQEKSTLMQAQILKDISQSINQLLKLTLTTHKDPRDQQIKIEPIDLSTIFPKEERNRELQQWTSKLVSKVLSQAFQKMMAGQLSQQQTKVYCSENFLRNIIELTKDHKNSLNSDDFVTINHSLKKSLKYSSCKYPLSDNTTEINKKLVRTISKINNLDTNTNNLILNSGLSFDFDHTGNYNEEIMKFINYITQITEVKDDTGKTRFQRFEEFCEKLFMKVENMGWVKSWGEDLDDSDDDLAEKYGQILKKVKQYQKSIEKSQQLKQYDQQYRQKVRSYTYYQIGRKISQNSKEYTQPEILSGNLDLTNSAISRILTKWCEQLEKKFFNPEYYLDKEEDWAQRSGSYASVLKSSKQGVQKMINKEKEKIEDFMREIEKNICQNQSRISYETLKNDECFYIEEEEKVLGKFAALNKQFLQTYLIVYLNRLLHGLIKVSQQFYDSSLKNYVNWKSPPQFITFLVGDLMRCKFSSGQKQVLMVYKQLQMLSQLEPEKLKIVRVKNRLKQGTNDILINVRFQNLILCEIQLAVKKNSTDEFLQNSDKFSHYVYELTRTKFGPIAQMANIWFSKDPRAKQFSNIIKQIEKKKKKEENIVKAPHLCKNFQYIVEEFPFTCSFCGINRFSNFYLTDILDNMKCSSCSNFFVCGHCRLKQMNEKTLLKIFFETRPQLEISSIKLNKKKTIPKYGIYVPIFGTKIQIEYFKSFEYEGSIYLIGLLNKQFRLLYEFEIDGLKENRFFEENILFEASQIPGLNQITSRSLIKDFIVKQYLRNAFMNGKQSLSLEGMNLTQADIILEENDENASKRVKSFILRNNNISEIGPITRKYSNLELLNLGNNKLTQLKGVSGFAHLRKLRAVSNKISQISSQIEQCKQLQVLSLNHNKIKQIPDTVCKLSKLSQLWISNNQISQLSPNFGNLTNLSHTIFDGNKLKQLPQSFGNLEKLQYFKINSNKLETLPQNFSKLKKLTKFFCVHNKLKQVPENFGQLKLVILNLNANQFEQFPVEICKLIFLKRLFISNNKIKKIPGQIKYLVSLIEFRANDNKIGEIPNEMQSLENLRILDMNQNQISELGANIGKLTKLVDLSFAKNRIKKLPKSFKHLTNLEKIDLSFNLIDQFPEQLLFLQKISTLLLHDNQIPTLPNDIWELHDLATLHIENNQIKEIPHSIQSLSNLRNIGVGNPNLHFISPIIYELKTIRFLQISCVGLEQLPANIFTMNELIELDFHGNFLTELPDQISQLTKLKLIQGDENKISRITPKINKLKILSQLRLKRNLIQEFPPQFFELKNLKFLNISYNQIKIISNEFSKLTGLMPHSLFLFQNPLIAIECSSFLLTKVSKKSAKLIQQIRKKEELTLKRLQSIIQMVDEQEDDENELIEQQN